MNGGIVFFGSKDLKANVDFYISRLGFEIWLDQGKCKILKRDNLLLGFCEKKNASSCGTITIFVDSKDEVKRLYGDLRSYSTTSPRENKEFRIYHFWLKDPEKRILEIQAFLHPLKVI